MPGKVGADYSQRARESNKMRLRRNGPSPSLAPFRRRPGRLEAQRMPPDSPALPPEFAANVPRIVAALERIAPPAAAKPDFAAAEAFVWQAASCPVVPVAKGHPAALGFLKGNR